ncbi:uncharacterized protein CIMG_13475 [Coccidioides immitis RS]|uniref:Uncharacterized protein n=1 Tax=Coccidioides immitis (strain RS) TaxID=246410 RepID=A0A0D8JV70_COCIM|nr:uncharacterized protein CIMG_13475 [Coccidioides immitis RS]KJF61192.1 hypothetical protein CIMG_13475 [Coccidioides immitis RS]
MRSEFSAARLINLHSLCVTAPLLGARVADDKTSAGQIIRYTVVSVGIPGRKTLTRLAKECQRVRLTAILTFIDLFQNDSPMIYARPGSRGPKSSPALSTPGIAAAVHLASRSTEVVSPRGLVCEFLECSLPSATPEP